MMRLTINHKSAITLIGCLNPNEANFEDSFNTLTHLDRCKNFEDSSKEKNAAKKITEMEDKPKAAPKPAVGKINVLAQIGEEIQDKRSKIEFLQADYKSKFDELSKLLKMDEDIEKLIQKPNADGSLY
jgi:hypothetical protein